jgi:prenyltransferase beta subunit
MRRAASAAPNLLREAGPRVVEFLRGQFNEDGGARDRAGNSDLYYTVFALEGLLALSGDPPLDALGVFLRGFDDGAQLDLVHRACLARCWAAMPDASLTRDPRRAIVHGIESYRSADGGYGARPGAKSGTVYHCFLALGAYQDMGEALPDPNELARCVDGLRTADGAYANERGLKVGTTTATAAAAVLLRQLNRPVPCTLGDWLLARCDTRGGFMATPGAPFPDLLSTATALHALAGMNVSLEPIRERCLDFLDSLWTGHAFRAHWADKVPDSEYTFYALLALGHLAS